MSNQLKNKVEQAEMLLNSVMDEVSDKLGEQSPELDWAIEALEVALVEVEKAREAFEKVAD